MDMFDTTRDLGRGILLINKKLEYFKVGGYVQSQFQWANEKGVKSFNGGDFVQNTDNRFMIRRGRVRLDYVHFSDNNKPSIQFVFQMDATERGVAIKDFWGRILENKYQAFSFTTGLFARPFGYELNFSSAVRESPERGRMSQTILKSERDLGAMISFCKRQHTEGFNKIKFDLGLFNGQGVNATAEFDSKKDLVGRISVKPISLSKNITLTAGASILKGGMLQNTKYVYRISEENGNVIFVVDSASSNWGKIAPREYYGSDLQLKINTSLGETECRGEYIAGHQTGTYNSSETPTSLLNGNEGHYIRKFNGAYFYLLQKFKNKKHQIGIKYDWYDPNTSVNANDIGNLGSNLSSADIKYATLGFGYNRYISENIKLLIWYDCVRNEISQLSGFTSDVKDDVVTIRFQFRF
jgi:phosphate-selective porin